ncbi:hypothetical protein TWF694_000420 [Orbilia ellipsospora]|uniref:Uncharacterized protein n=1 Tax=Orbilia ellipsospora TaxID=2528407 RepID=A0AAV9XNM4_9PEZI
MDFLISSPADFLQSDNCPGRLQLHGSDADGVVLSRKPYRSGQASRLSGPPKFPLSLPFSLFPSFKDSGSSREPSFEPRNNKRNSDSRLHSEVPKTWQSDFDFEDRLGKLDLGDKSYRNYTPVPIADDKYHPGVESDRASFIFSSSDEEKRSNVTDRSTISDWEAVPIYRTAHKGYGGSGASSGVSRHSNRSSGSGQQSHGYRGFQSGGGGGAAGGNNGSPPSLPQPIDPPPSDGKKYYACWFWLHDPVKYHACADIRKEAHHLKHIHLPQHFPAGLPPELKHRMNYDAVWQMLFPGQRIPRIKDRDEQLLVMAQGYQSRLDTQLPISSPAPRRDMGPMSPESSRHRSDAAGESSRRQSSTLSAHHGHHSSNMKLRRLSGTGRHPRRYPSSHTSTGRTNWDSSSHASLLDFDNDQNYILSAQNLTHRLDEVCRMLPDSEGIMDPVDMDIESDYSSQMSSNESIEIDKMQRESHPFRPFNPRIKVKDYSTGEEYFWDERHHEIPFDFSRYYLVHCGDRSTGADGLISMRSMEVLEREYHYNLMPRLKSDGYVVLQRARHPYPS